MQKKPFRIYGLNSDFYPLKTVDLSRHQSGSVLIITLLVLLAVTIIGVASIDKSIVELKIARNEKELREIFYLSEGACMEGIQRLLDTDLIDLEDQIQSWHHSKKVVASGEVDFRAPDSWDVDGVGEDNGLTSSIAADTYVAAVEWKVASGASLVQTDTRLYQNRVYGLCEKYGAENIVEIGYYIRY